MDVKAVSAKAQTVIEPILADMGYELVDCELACDRGWVLRVYIDKKEGGVDIEDCAGVSRALGAALDVEDLVPARYALEVSSPGLDRPLKKLEDFERFKGEKAKIKTEEPIDGRGNYFGRLQGVEGNDILISVDGVEYRIPLAKIAKARLEYKG